MSAWIPAGDSMLPHSHTRCISCAPVLVAVKRRFYATSSQIGLVEPHNPGLPEGDTEVLLQHGLED